MPTGTVIVDLGAAVLASSYQLIGTPVGDKIFTVTGQTNILASSLVEAFVMPVATADHSIDEHMVENLRVIAGDITPGTGFKIMVEITVGSSYGLWTIGWVWV